MKSTFIDNNKRLTFVAMSKPGEAWGNIFPKNTERVVIIGLHRKNDAPYTALKWLASYAQGDVSTTGVNADQSNEALAFRIPNKQQALPDILNVLQQQGWLNSEEHEDILEKLMPQHHISYSI